MARVMAGARDGVASSRRPSRADRIWFSSGWRLAWAAALASFALIEAFAVSAAGDPGGTRRSKRATAVRESAAAAEALGLPDRGWVGASVVTNEGTAHGAMEVPL